jgi:hypothetical protein
VGIFIFIFIVIVTVVVWFVYSGMQRQNARFGIAAPVTQVPDAPLPQRHAQTASSEPIESVPLYVNLQQSFHGKHDKIVQTLNDVTDMLQREVDVRQLPAGQTAKATPVDHETYRNLVSLQSNRFDDDVPRCRSPFRAGVKSHRRHARDAQAGLRSALGPTHRRRRPYV